MKETGYLINGTKECFVYLFDLLQDEPRSNSFRRSRDSKDSTDSYTRKSFYIYISDLLEYLLCSDVRLNRMIYYNKRLYFVWILFLILCWQQITSSLGIILVNKTY